MVHPMETLTGTSEVTITYKQVYEAPFRDVEFYEGLIATVTKGDRSVSVESVGNREVEKAHRSNVEGVGDMWEILNSAEEFRSAFPDGTIPDDGSGGIIWNNNGWFEFHDHGDTLDLVEPKFDYFEAVQTAIDLVLDDEIWGDV